MSKQLKEKPEQGLFLLPGGYIPVLGDGVCHKLVKLRQLTGREEEMIFEADVTTNGNLDENNSNSNIITLMTNILANCIENIGPLHEINADLVRQLLICDRDYLLLKLRQITFGDRIDARLQCPNESCKKLMDVKFDISTIDVQRKDIGNGIFSIHLSPAAVYKDNNSVKHRDVEFRLPNVADQEEIFNIHKEGNESKALTKLFHRCLLRVGNVREIDENLVYSLPILARREIDMNMQEFSPKVDLQISTKCPECGLVFSSPFDFQKFFLGK
jgi:hypothetical protein